MTDLQVKYQTLLETERSNKAKEAENARTNDIKEVLTSSQVSLNDAQISKLANEVQKVQAEIASINANTELTEAKRQSQIQSIINGWINFGSNVLGIPTWFNTEETQNITKSMANLGSAAKSFSSSFE